MQVLVTESGSISTDFAFDNPQYTPSERDALRYRTLTKIKTKSPSADSCEGDIVSHVMQEISTDTSTTSSFVFGATIEGNDDHSGELFSSNLDVTGVSDHAVAVNNAAAVNNTVGDDTMVEKLFPTDDSTLSTDHPNIRR